MRLVDIDDIRVMKFLSEEDDPSESDGEREYRNGWNDAIDAINDIQPSVEPKKGKWIDTGQHSALFPYHDWCCSECGENVIEIDMPWFKFCPNCGAEMSEGEENE